MGQELFDHQKVGPVINLDDQAVVIMPDVENQQRPELVGIRKVLPDIAEVTPNSMLGCFGPTHQFFRRIRVIGGIRFDRCRANHVHVFMLAFCEQDVNA
jgi:hypothetical protein